MTTYIVVETYRNGPEPVYERFDEKGRMLPDGLKYINSWLESGTQNRCFQLMETDDPSLFDVWIAKWDDLVDFEVVPVDRSPTATGPDES